MTIGWGYGGKTCSRCPGELGKCSRCPAFENLLHLAPPVFDRVDIRRIGRQVFNAGYCRCNGLLDARHFVRCQVIHHDDVSWSERWNQPFFHPGQEQLPIHRAIEEPRGLRPALSEGGNQCGCLIVSVRHGANQSLANGAAATTAGHLCVGAAFIQKYQAAGWNCSQLLRPLSSGFGHVGSGLLGGVQRFFQSSAPGGPATNRWWRWDV